MKFGMLKATYARGRAAAENLAIRPLPGDSSRWAETAAPYLEDSMAICEVCGNDYYLSFQVVAAGHTHTFDSFECAIHKLAPVCQHCHCKIVGHGIEANNTYYCCAHCAREHGVTAAADHV
jgi:hypothetical protein